MSAHPNLNNHIIKHDINKGPIYLYCIPRNDMATMCAGRMAAQVSHASTKMVFDILNTSKNERFKELLDVWQKEAGGFGTTIVLKPITENQESELRDLILAVRDSKEGHDIFTGIVIDPEYYVPDGSFYHRMTNVMTCVFLFGYKEDIKKFVGDYPLY